MSTADVLVGMTEQFDQNYTKSAPDSKLESVRDFIQKTWEQELPDEYGVAVTTDTDSYYTGPTYYSNYNDRLNDIQSAAPYDLSAWDGIIVMDHYDTSTGTYGLNPSAGTFGDDVADIIGAVDAAYEDTGSLPIRWDRLGSEGVSAHELFNIADALDSKASVLKIRSEAYYGTLMLDTDVGDTVDYYCTKEGDRNRPNIGDISDCNRDRITSFLDSQGF